MIAHPNTQYADTADEAKKLLPAWFIPRMMTGDCQFGLLLSSGIVLPISKIRGVAQDAAGDIWLDVAMVTYKGGAVLGIKVPNLPTSKLEASVNAKHVVAALELSDE